MDDELAIIRQAKENVQAFTQLYDHYFPKMYRYVQRRVLIKEVTEDIVSRIFLKSIEHIKSFDESKSDSLSPWLYRIAHNEVVSYYRKHSRQTIVSSEESRYPSVTFEHQVLEAETVAKALSGMKPKYQQVIALKYFEELPHKEIAKIMQTSENNVSVMVNRAMQMLSKAITEKL